MKGNLNEFYEKAMLLRHDVNRLQAGETIVTYTTFATLEEGRQLLSVATNEQRIARQETFFNPPLIARQRLGQGIHDRGEAILFANGTFLQGDGQGVGNHMPAHLKAISVLRKTIHAGQIWDVSVRGEAWGLDDMEELYTTLNVGELVIEAGASLIVRGNVFSLLCQKLVCMSGNNSSKNYHIGILPTPFSVDLKHGEMDGVKGIDGLHGYNGNTGVDVQASSSILGYMLSKAVTPDEMQGGNGTNGQHGTDGTDGRNGGMCKIAEISIRDLLGNLTVFAQAGSGGNGGISGNGGNGGDGGNGSNGYKLIKGEILPAGHGGNGANGGNGGNGGKGGNGGLASNIYITLPVSAEHHVHCTSIASVGGKGAPGGKKGTAGKQGKGGNGPIWGNDGVAGISGLDGKNGLDGKYRWAPWMFVNEKKVAGYALVSNPSQETVAIR